jgi:hypothetical protein
MKVTFPRVSMYCDVLESPITNDIGPDSSKASIYNYKFELIEFS